MQQNPVLLQVIRTVLIGVLSLLALRMALVNRFVFLALVAGVGLFFGIRYLWNRREQIQRERRFGKTMSGEVANRRRQVREEIVKIREQIQEIDDNIHELREELHRGRDLPESTKQKTRSVILAFENQRDLRAGKRDFFQLADEKLATLERNHRLIGTLAQKEELLRALRESNQDTIADLEAFKENMRYDQSFLDTIDRLSSRILDVDSASDASILREELSRMTKELKDL